MRHQYVLIIAGWLFCCISSVSAQDAAGSWHAVSYGAAIKLVYTPAGYQTNENITNAVIAKPSRLLVKLQQQPGGGVALSSLPGVVFTGGKTGQGGYAIRTSLQNGEKIFGGGERALPLNRRGYRFQLYNNPWYGYTDGADDLNFSVPFFTSSNGYALFFDNASRGYADIGKSDSGILEAGFSSGELNVYIIQGKNYQEILSRFFQLTGRQPLPPRWALGNFQSRFGYTSQQQAIAINNAMQQQQIPHDAIIFDLFWFGDSIKGTLGNLDWVNKQQWPNPVQMMADFKKKNVQTILITEPFILEQTKNYQQAIGYCAVDSSGKPFRLTNFYFGYGGLLDIFRKDAGNWIWANHYQKQISNGVAGWWTDLGEPEKHPAGMLHNLADLGYQRKFGADEVHNAYGHYWNKMLYEKYSSHYPSKRLFHLNRSGFAGSQRYSIFPWSGDVSRSWSGFIAQLTLMQGMSMSGIPYIHADAGGFAGGEGDFELYTRWLQFAAYTPIFRPHGTALYEVDKNAFSFNSEPALMPEPYRSYARQVVQQRYAMLPYNYTLAYLQAAQGQPLVAPLYYYFAADTNTYHTADQFMWGDKIMVAPVLEKNALTRAVYLPGGGWYANNSNTLLQGNSWHTASLKPDAIPVFIKAGSIIPLSAAAVNNIAADKLNQLELHYYKADSATTAIMYDDDGETKDVLATGNYRITQFTVTPKAGGLQFYIAAKGIYKAMPAKRNFNLVLHGMMLKGKVIVNNKPYKNLQQQADGSYQLTVTETGKPLLIIIQ
ncbi:MAG: hypothetical protein RL172_1279 [Bacteroidota bacterium]